jgi:uncharacterized protein (UPF0248 family)
MPYPRHVLNELKWNRHALEEADIIYVHRGAPGDVLAIKGSDIVDLERSFFVTADSKIPYHRIRKITLRGEVLYEERDVKKEEGSERVLRVP